MTTPRNRQRLWLNHQPEAVTYARVQAELTKSRLADTCGVSPSLISEIEAGTRNATSTMLTKLAEVLNCPRVVLLRKAPAWWDVLPSWSVRESHDGGVTWQRINGSSSHPCRCLALFEAMVIIADEWMLPDLQVYQLAQALKHESIAYDAYRGIRVVKTANPMRRIHVWPQC